ncbi:hypothetical protein U27_05540 [Candidatus Vecturithrix granuli]|uniref:Uncharacterized protein n=1 Tax=Vecturithrix granuli TaxID=1499967 RepID=A0A081C1W1_VECG1|nr:hypothetical protein U27_05540 [Candidatus Vecturithrix granuli]
MSENNLSIKRNFAVTYNKVADDLWSAYAELNDEQHNIMTRLDISIPNLTIRDASIIFNKKPMEQCQEISEKAKCLIGVSIIHDLTTTLNELFVGADGCPNIRSLFGISGPGFIYVYYPQLIKEGKYTHQEWWKMAATELKDECIAHKRLSEKYSK